jgi:hypothetical protein
MLMKDVFIHHRAIPIDIAGDRDRNLLKGERAAETRLYELLAFEHSKPPAISPTARYDVFVLNVELVGYEDELALMAREPLLKLAMSFDYSVEVVEAIVKDNHILDMVAGGLAGFEAIRDFPANIAHLQCPGFDPLLDINKRTRIPLTEFFSVDKQFAYTFFLEFHFSLLKGIMNVRLGKQYQNLLQKQST